MNSIARVLLLSAKPKLAQPLQSFLSHEFSNVDYIRESQQAIVPLGEGRYDLLLLSNQLDDCRGIDYLHLLKNKGIDVPFIMISGDQDVRQAVDVMKEGAVEFIQWSNDTDSFFPYIAEVVRKALQEIIFKSYFKEGEVVYKTLFDNLRDAVFLHMVDPETLSPGTFVEVNQVACSRLGYTRQEFFSMTPWDIHVPGSVDMKGVVTELYEKGSVIFKTRHATKDGRQIPVEINSRLFDLKGNKAVLAIARNITNQQKILDDLKNSEQRFRSIIESCIVGICITDENGYFEYVNDEYCKIYNYSPDEMLGQHFTMVALPEQKKFLAQRHDEFIHSGQVKKKEFKVVDKLGNHKIITADATRITDSNGQYRKVTFVEDITGERKAKEALRKSEKKYRTMLENLQDPIFISDKNYNVIYINKAFKKRFGAVKQHAKCYNSVFGLKEPCSWCMVALENMSRFRKRLEKTINRRVYQITTVPIQFENVYQAKMTILRDVTKVVKARKRAEESDRLKSAFLANISHEIRTPLNAVLGFANLLKDEDITKDEITMYVDMINESSSHLMHVIDNIIEFSFIDSGLVQVHPVKIEINEFIDELRKETIQLQSKMEKHNLDISFQNLLPDEILVKSDQKRVQQILLNFLSNAVKFTELGGIEFKVFYTENKWVVFSVKDTGIGIPEQQHQVIFRRFRQADEGHTRLFGGSGLGLALSKHLAGMLGGYIKLESEPGKGSEFMFFMPEKFDESLAKVRGVNYKK